MKSKMDLESNLYLWKIIQWVVPGILLVLGTSVGIYSNFNIHKLETQIQEFKDEKAEHQRQKDKSEIISTVDRTSGDNKQLIEYLKNITDTELRERNKIIGELYNTYLWEFLAQFRFVLHCLDKAKPLDNKIIEAFQPSNLTKGLKLSLIDDKMVYDIVMEYDLKRPSENCDFTSSVFLRGLTINLNKRTKDILDKYAATGSPELIKEIELLANYTDNLIGPFGPWSINGAWSDATNSSEKPREQAARDLNELILKLKNDIELTKIYLTNAQHYKQ